MRFGLVVEYDGACFSGSQLQASARTVQGELESALRALFGENIRPRLASRTDAGVHAMGQVAAFSISDTKLDTSTIRNALNHYLPPDAAVRVAARVPDDFDPRRQAVSREYAYTIRNCPVRPALHRRQEAHVSAPLDVEAMKRAARLLEGVRDFAAFAGGGARPGANTVRRMRMAKMERCGERVVATFRANAFLYQQVRRMVAALVAVGGGALSIARFMEVLERGGRGAFTQVFPPHGLCLRSIEYPDPGPSGLPMKEKA